MIDRACTSVTEGAGPCFLNCILLLMILSFQIQTNLILGLIVSSSALMG